MKKKSKITSISFGLMLIGALLLIFSYVVWSNPSSFHPFLVDYGSDTFGIAGAVLLGGILAFIYGRIVT